MKTDWSKFTQALLRWFHEHKRDLPWRQTRDPYAIWISEVMLQQTGVKTVLPYFQNFLKKFPTIHHLAGASLQEVLKSWQGLGYYSRARHLHGTACEVRAKYGGELPRTRETLLELRGIGPYTASAIASIAFGEATPVVDGNVWRVFSRILADASPPERGKKNVFEFLTKIIPHSDPSSFNQAIMELGSLVCMPRNPNCAACPVQSFCVAYAKKTIDKFPAIPVKKPIPHRNWVTLTALHEKRVFLQQRPLKGIWGGLWEFPSVPIKSKKNLKTAAQQIAREFKLAGPLKNLSPIHHAFSHFKLTLHPFFLSAQKRPRIKKGVWAYLRENRYPLPTPHLKIVKQLQNLDSKATKKL